MSFINNYFSSFLVRSCCLDWDWKEKVSHQWGTMHHWRKRCSSALGIVQNPSLWNLFHLTWKCVSVARPQFDHSVAYSKSSWSEFRPAADLNSIPRFLAVACSWVAGSHAIGLQIPTKSRIWKWQRGREDKGRCRCMQSKTWALSNWGDCQKSQSQFQDVSQSSCV